MATGGIEPTAEELGRSARNGNCANGLSCSRSAEDGTAGENHDVTNCERGIENMEGVIGE